MCTHGVSDLIEVKQTSEGTDSVILLLKLFDRL